MKRGSGWRQLAQKSFETIHRNPKLIRAHVNRLMRAPKLTREQEIAAQEVFLARNGVKRWCEYDGNSWGTDVRVTVNMRRKWRSELAQAYEAKTNRHMVRSKRGLK